MNDIECRLLVIGAGPGGYACAIRAGQLGIDTVVVESRAAGGTCLNIGCIPSKALIHAADVFHGIGAGKRMGISTKDASIDMARTVAWKDAIVSRLTTGVEGLLKKAGVRVINGRATFLDGKTVAVSVDEGDTNRIVAEAVVVATGSAPADLPALPFGGKVISSEQALSLQQVPKRLAVIGGGYIGIEIGTAYAKLGSQVTVIEAAERILPQYDRELTGPVERKLRDLGVELKTRTVVRDAAKNGKVLELDDGSNLDTDLTLVTVGRKPALEGCGLEELDLRKNGPYLAVDAQCRTSMRGVYAVGDVTGEPMLAHRAIAQGVMVAQIVAGQRREWSQLCIPTICFSDPEIVSVGMNQVQAETDGRKVVTGKFPLAANGRSLTLDRDDGFVRVMASAEDHVVLGIDAVGAGVSEMSSQFALAIEMGATLADIEGTIHAHPTLGEAFHEASLAAMGNPLHM